MCSLDVVLREDVWFPGGKQFCTTPIYRRICRLLENGFRVSFLSPDISIVKDGKKYYYES